MSRIGPAFKTLRQRGEGALIGYLMAGDPSPGRDLEYIGALIEGGLDLLEVGVPFSDPIADGPVIQSAGVRALRAGTTPAAVFELVRRVRNEPLQRAQEIPIVLMTYYNPVLALGEADFLKRCAEVGIDGVIVPDLPVEESASLGKQSERYRVDTIYLATPETDAERLARIARETRGFLYLVSRYGVTGAPTGLGADLDELISQTRRAIPAPLPLAVGFGISGPEQVRAVIRAGAEGAIVGSALVERVAQGVSPQELGGFARALKSATHRR